MCNKLTNSITNFLQDSLIFLWPWYRKRQLYVIADATDNSVTLSKALCRRMKLLSLEEARVFVFRIPDSGYGFMLNPDFEEETQLNDIQYNAKYRTVGFETLCPTVNRIFYDYGIPHDRVRLSVAECRLNLERTLTYYKIMRPDE